MSLRRDERKIELWRLLEATEQVPRRHSKAGSPRGGQSVRCSFTCDE